MRPRDKRVVRELARILIACQSYADSTDESIAWWAVWLDQARAAGFELSTLDIIASARKRRFACAIWGGNRELVPALDRMLESHEVSDDEREQLFGIASMARRREHQIGLWAAQLPDGYEGGWGLRGDFDVSFARAVVGEASIDAVAHVFEDQSLDKVSQLTRAVAHGAASWDIELPVGFAPLEQLWDALMDALELPTASEGLRRWLERPSEPHAGVEPALALRLSGTALVSARLIVPTSDRIELAAALAGAGIPESADAHLAAIAGALDTSPIAAILVLDKSGFDLELAY